MTHIVAVSPHLDDAAFSVGGFLAARARAGDRITIVTCFTGNVTRPQGFALACQRDKGLSDEADYMALRRKEDHAACATIGAHPIHLPFLEAPHRGYDSPAALFAGPRANDSVHVPLAETLEALIAGLAPDLTLLPLAIGNHVDHWAVRRATAALPGPVLSWEDWPYFCRSDRPVRSAPALSHSLSDLDRSTRLQMCSAYASQIGFQFGGLQSLTERINEIAEERLFADSR